MNENDTAAVGGVTISVETTLSKLEQILQRMESEEQPLEASLADFEEGIRLTRLAQKTLAEAEQKVQLLTENSSGEPQVSTLAVPDEDNGDDGQ
ncbi:MAG: exodeoxyribonuclease VII small subunit [Chromatocurvus sp.]